MKTRLFGPSNGSGARIGVLPGLLALALVLALDFGAAWRLQAQVPAAPVDAGEFNFSTTFYQCTDFETFAFSPYPRNTRDVRGVLVTVTRTSQTGGPVVGRVMVDFYTTNLPPFDPLPPEATNVTFVRPGVPDVDYEVTTNTLIFDDFQTSTNFFIRVAPDGVWNGNALFSIVLANPRAYTNYDNPQVSENPEVIVPTLGLDSVTDVLIAAIEDYNPTVDATKFISFERLSVREDEDGVYVDIFLVYPPGGPQSVLCRLVRNPPASIMAGSSEALPTADHADIFDVTVTFPAGQPYQLVRVNIPNDSLVEFNEDFVVFLQQLGGQRAPHPFANVASATIVFEDQPAGALDRDWNPDFVRTTPDQPYNITPGANGEVNGVVIQTDGKTVLAGEFTRVNTKVRNRIARMNVDGSLDTTFQPSDGANSTVNRVLLYPISSPQTGKILIAGSFTTYDSTPRRGIARLNPNGSLDATFSPGNGPRGYDGEPATIWAVVIQPDDKIVVSGDFVTFNDVTRYGLARLNPNGSLDDTFDPLDSTDGLIRALALDTSVPPRIYIGGEFTYYNGVFRSGIARLNSDASLDSTFLEFSTGTDGPVYALAVQTDGAIVVGGNFYSIDQRSRSGVARLLTDGMLDTTFDPGTGFNDAVYTLTLDPGGQALAGGPFTLFNSTRRMGLARLKTDGTLDTTFLDTAYNQFAGLFHHFSYDPPNYINSIAVQTDGNVMIGGSFTNVGGNCHITVRGGYHGFQRDFVRNRFNLARLIGHWGGSTTGTVVTNVVGGTNVIITNVVVTVNPPQGPGNAQFITDDYTVDENGSFLAVEFRRVISPLGIIGAVGILTADFTTSNRLAEANLDYLPVADLIGFPTIVWPPQTYYYPVDVLDDTLEEGDETLDLRLSNPLSWTTLNGERHTFGGALGVATSLMTIADDDRKPGVLTFASRDYVTNENAVRAVISVVRTNGTFGKVGVQYYTRDGSAQAPGDYTAIPSSPIRSLNFNDGVTKQTFTVTLFNDNEVEDDETISLVLTNATGGATLPGGLYSSTDIATLTIVDDDFPQGRLNFAFTIFTNAEADVEAVITVTRTGGDHEAISVRYLTTAGTATALADYTNVAGILNWDDRDASTRTFRVPLVVDGIVDNVSRTPETVNLVLYDASKVGLLGSRTNATLQIVDSDYYGVLEFSEPLYVVDENGTNAIITVSRSGGVAGTVSVNYRTEPDNATAADYVPTSGTISMGPGRLSKTFTVQLLDDTVKDGEKRVRLVLSDPAPAGVLGPRSTAILQIVDDESFNLPAGSVDTTFNADAQADGPVYALALQPDGDVLIGGEFTKVNQLARRRVARLDSLGNLDSTFNVGTGPDYTVQALALQPDGRLLIGGSFTNFSGTNRPAIVRVNSDGSLDRFFNPGAGADNPIYAITLQPDDKILIGGAFASIDGWSRFGIARLNTNGTVDASFNPRSGANGNVYAVALQPDGKVVIGGEFTLVDGVLRNHIARLLPDGRLDPSFAADLSGSVRAILVQADGKVIVGGSFTNVNGVARNFLARLYTDGSLDPAYLDGMSGADSTVFALAQQVDGKTLVAGDFTIFNDVTRNRLTRLNPDGSNDPSINFGNGANAFVAALVVQPDRNIVIGGGFTTYGDEPRRSVARIYGGSIAGPGRLEFTAAEYRVFENGTNAVVTVRRVGGTTGAVSADFNTTNNTAVAGIDYLSTNGTVRFPQAETRQRFVVPILNNTNVFDGDRRLYLGLSGYGGGATPGPQPLASVLILNDDSLVSFSLGNFSVPENPVSGNATVPVIRSGSTNSTLVVSFTTGTNGTATPGLDYVPTNGAIIFLPGDTAKNFNVPIFEDTLIEGNETIDLLLTSVTPTNAAQLSLAAATLTIADNDFAAGQIFFAATNLSVNEYETNITITVVRTNGSSGIVTVDFATSDRSARVGQDYLYAAGTLTFQNNESVRTIDVPIVPDYAVESTETFLVTLSNPTGGATLGNRTVATVRILDNELIHGSLSFTSNNFSVVESLGNVTLTVSRLLGSLGNITVSYRMVDQTASNGFDYIAVTGQLNWSDGDAAPKSFSVPILNDALVESDETFRVELFGPTGGSSLGLLPNAAVTIRNDDFGPGYLGFVAPTFTVAENGTNATITVARTFGFSGQVSIDFSVGGGSARPFLDYVPTNGTLVFPDGVTNQSFTIPILDNGVVAGDKSIELQLANPGSGASTNQQTIAALLTIVDNESEAGSVDTALSGAGADGPVETVVVLSNSDSLLVGGQFTAFGNFTRRHIARLFANGSVDSTFDPGNSLNGAVVAIAANLGETNYYVGGYFSNAGGVGPSYFTRMTPAGLVDTNFLVGLSGVDNYVAAIIVQSDGKVILGGHFTSVNGASRNRIARLLPSGALDPTFGGVASANELVRALALQPDGKIILAGDFTEVNGVPRARIARLNSNGTLDPTFNPGAGADDSVRAVALQPDGRIVLGGSFAFVDGFLSLGVARLNSTGSVDAGFAPGPGTSDFVASVALQPDGKILLGGAFTEFYTQTANVTRNRLVRLHPDGFLDYSLNLGAGANNFISTVAVQPDRKIVLGGGFTEFDGTPRSYLARLHGGDNIGSGTVSFISANFNVVEANTNLTLTVRRHLGTSNTVQVSYATLDGTATNFIHYLPTNGVLTFPPGEPFATLVVPILDDPAPNNSRRFTVTLSDPLSTDLNNPATVGTPGTATVTILNNDQLIGFSSATFFAGENGPSALITVDRLFGTAGAVSVEYRTGGGSATAGADYGATSGTLFFANGQAQAAFTVPIINDAIVEGNETLNLFLTNVTGAATTSLAQATLMIVDDDFSPGAIGFSQANFFVDERGTNAVINVIRSGGSAGPAAVDFATSDGTASGLDYLGTNGTLIFADGVFVRSFLVPILDDALVEGDEVVRLTLSNPVGSPLGLANADLTISADEAQFSFAATGFATNESGTNAIITVVRVGGATGPVSVEYATSNLTATAGLDYSNTVGTLTFQPDETSKSFLVPIINDDLGEGDEDVLLALTTVVGEGRLANPSNSVLTILDDDVSFSFSQPTYAFIENSGGALVTVNRTGITNRAGSVNFATSDGTAIAGSDYVFTSMRLDFAPGEVAKGVVVPLIDDGIGEPVEFFQGNLNVINPGSGVSVGTPGVARIEIVDNEDTFSFGATTYQVDESATNVVIDIVRNGRPSTNTFVTVTFNTANGTATAGQDYVAVTNVVVSFSLGQLIQQVTIPLLDDSLIEGDETVLLRLSNATGGPKLVEPAEAVLTIIDNDVGVSLGAAAYSVAENAGSASIAVNLVGVASNAVVVTFEATNGTATPFVDFIPIRSTVTFLPGESNQVVTIPFQDDLVIEGSETILLRLFDVTNAILATPSSAVLTILDDDASVIIPAGASIVSESGPVNQFIDPNETVTVDFGFRNVGNVDTVSLLATLLATNGVTQPNPAANSYGVVVGGGSTVVRRYTFRAVGTNGGVIQPTFALVDLGNNNNLGTTNFTFVLGQAVRTFANPAAITINDLGSSTDVYGRSTPYPSEIVVSDVVGSVSKVTVTLANLTHDYPGDMDILLVGPAGTNAMLLSDAMGNGSLNNVTFTFDDTVSSALPVQSAVPSGTYHTTNYGILSDPFPAPFPSPAPLPYGKDLSVFNGKNPNGTWRLYVVDDVSGQEGNIAGGWSLTIATTDALKATPDLGVSMQDAPDPVVVGALLTNIITVANYGPGTATNFVVNNSLPAGLQLVTNRVPAGVTYTNIPTTNIIVSVSGLGQTETNVTVSYTIAFRYASLAAGVSVAVTNITRTAIEGSMTNASALATSQVDLNLDNNAFSAKTTVAPLPVVMIFRKDNKLVLAWPVAASGFVLEGTTSLALPQWTPVDGERVASGGLITVTLDATGAMRYFRLRSP